LHGEEYDFSEHSSLLGERELKGKKKGEGERDRSKKDQKRRRGDKNCFTRGRAGGYLFV